MFAAIAVVPDVSIHRDSSYESINKRLELATTTTMECIKGPSPTHSKESVVVDDVQTLLESLYIERKQPKQCRMGHNNPFKRKTKNKHKRKHAICYNASLCKDILEKLNSPPSSSISEEDTEDDTTKVMLKITNKMAKIWNLDGYRDGSSSSTTTTSTSTSNGDTSKGVNVTTTAESINDETSENHSQVSSQTCARQAMYDYSNSSVTELAAYLDETLFIPKKMSFMAEMMYT